MKDLRREKKIVKLSFEGNILAYKWHANEMNGKACVLICHGMADHIERYDGFARDLSEKGFIVYGYNHRGHKGTCANIANFGYASDHNNFDILVTDLKDIVEIVKEENPNLPLFILGHSMGSFISMRFAELYSNMIDGLILSGSSKMSGLLINFGYLLAGVITGFKGRKYPSKLLNKLSFGAYNKPFKPNRTDFDWLNRDNAEVDKYVNDEWCGGIVTASFYRDFLNGLRIINHNYELISKQLPILIISGSKDPVGGEGKLVNKLYKSLVNKGINDVALKLYDGARHEILLETNKEEIYNDISTWLHQHLKNSINN